MVRAGYDRWSRVACLTVVGGTHPIVRADRRAEPAIASDYTIWLGCAPNPGVRTSTGYAPVRQAHSARCKALSSRSSPMSTSSLQRGASPQRPR